MREACQESCGRCESYVRIFVFINTDCFQSIFSFLSFEPKIHRKISCIFHPLSESLNDQSYLYFLKKSSSISLDILRRLQKFEINISF